MHAHNDNTPAPTARPASFDAMLVSYRPGLSHLAFRLGFRGDERDDLVTDTIIHCLKHWQNYRPDHSEWNYLYWTMRAIATKQKISAGRRPRLVEDPEGRHAARLSFRPTQEDYVELSQVLAKMPAKGGDILMRRARGEPLETIAVERRVTRQRVQQIESETRHKLAVACGRVAA